MIEGKSAVQLANNQHGHLHGAGDCALHYVLIELRKFTKNAKTAGQQVHKKAKEASDQLKITQALTATITGFPLFYMLPMIVYQLAIRLDFINELTAIVLTAVSEMLMQVNRILNFFTCVQRMRDVRVVAMQLMHLDSGMKTVVVMGKKN